MILRCDVEKAEQWAKCCHELVQVNAHMRHKILRDLRMLTLEVLC